MSELEALLASAETAAMLDAVLASTPAGSIIVCAPDGKIVRVSDLAAQLLGVRQKEAEGRFISEILDLIPGYDAGGRRIPLEERPVIRALRGETVAGFELWVEAKGTRIPVDTNAVPIRNPRGNVIGAISIFCNLTPYKALEQSLREALMQREDAVAQRETLYRELTHRVKNHLHIMSALVSLEARDKRLSTSDFAEHVKAQLQTMGAVYKSMDRAEVGALVEASSFLEDVCRLNTCDAVNVESEVAPSDLTLTSDQAGPIGMLVNEAVCNSRKHAFPDREGRIFVALRRLEPGRLRLEVSDDGVGWPGSPEAVRASHGLELMRMFAKQLGGDLELRGRPRGGALVAAEIPEPAGR